jgi:hypothetical protein
MSTTVETNAETILKCNHCNRVCLNGISDFYSLIKNSTTICSTCVKCRRETYKSYKKINTHKYKNKVVLSKEELSLQISNHTRCYNCNRRTTSIDDYKHLKKNKICKTCIECRKSASKYYEKKKLALKESTVKLQEDDDQANLKFKLKLSVSELCVC